MAYRKLGLAFIMLVAGSINTISVKLMDQEKSENSAGEIVLFNHPIIQTLGMFLGEMLCLVLFHAQKMCRSVPSQPTPFNPMIFWPVALFDIFATLCQCIALTLINASTFQIIRCSAMALATFFLPMICFRRPCCPFHWNRYVGMTSVIIGLTSIGILDISEIDLSSRLGHTGIDQLIGGILVVIGEICVALKLIFEEKAATRYNVPSLQVIGHQGLFGFFLLAILLIPFYSIPGHDLFGSNPRNVIEDAKDALYQFENSWKLSFAYIVSVISLSSFNFGAITVTKEISATTRMFVDSIRTLAIWIVSLAFGWQSFQALQILGFVLLIVGMCLYDETVFDHISQKLRQICNQYNRLDDTETQSQASDDSENEGLQDVVVDPSNRKVSNNSSKYQNGQISVLRKGK